MRRYLAAVNAATSAGNWGLEEDEMDVDEEEEVEVEDSEDEWGPDGRSGYDLGNDDDDDDKDCSGLGGGFCGEPPPPSGRFREVMMV